MMRRLCKLIGLILLLISCNSGNNANVSTNATSVNLEGYIGRLNYIPVENNAKYQFNNLKSLLDLKDFASNGNQTSIYVASPVSLSSIVVGYYNDTVCNNQVAFTSFNGGVTMQAGTYYTSDASNQYLCNQYNYNSRSGCSGALAGAQAGDYKSMQIIYNFTNGSSSRSLCLYNQFNGNGYEATANYSDPQNPVACSSSNCGYSTSYLTSGVGINSFSIAYSSATTANSCYLNESSNNNLECWGAPVNGAIGNGYVIYPAIMPDGVESFSQVSTNISFSCAIAGSGTNAGKVYCWGNGGSGKIGNGATIAVNVPTSVTMPAGVESFSQVSTNSLFSCALAGRGTNAGKVYCWGAGTSGQIGNGASSNVNVPTSVMMPSGVGSFSQVSTNNDFSCAIAGSGTNSGKVYCWGTGTSGQIGNGAKSNVNVPTQAVMPSGVGSFNQISTNTYFSCAIAGSGTNTGKVYCWGTGGSGQIGNSTNNSATYPTQATMPSGVESFSQISTNNYFSCALAGSGTNAGKVYCWGTGGSGQIGNESSSNVNVPTSVTMPSGVDSFSQVSTNTNFSCAIAGSGTNAGKVYCWGTGTSGQIGNGATSTVNVPTQATMPSGVDSFSQVSTNTSFSCALAGSGANAGKVYCWGSGTTGQIGNGIDSTVNIPTLVTMPSGVESSIQISTNTNFSCAIASSGTNAGKVYCWGGNLSVSFMGSAGVAAPRLTQQPSGVSTYNQLSTNASFSCAISGSGANAGKVYCWGLGVNGQIGNGVSSNVNVPTQATMPSGVNSFSQVSTNSNFSCALAGSGESAGKVYCWGGGGSGRIGNGITTDATIPTSVTMPLGVNSFSQVSTNSNFSCALAGSGTNAGKVYCWGVGTSGQIGNGASSSVNVPTQATMPSGVDGFSQVSTNSSFSCALAGIGESVGKVYCWGNGTNGQIGNGANSTVNVPTSVTMPSGVNSFSQVSTNSSFSCAIAGSGTNAGKVYCWGAGTNGRIGNGANSSVNVPTLVTTPSGVDSFSQVSTNTSFSCALAGSGVNAGRVYCWGGGTGGQIGNGASSDVNVPTSVTMPSGVSAFGQVWTSNNYACAIAASGVNAGKRYCWGDNFSGQLGTGDGVNKNIPTLVN